MRASIIMILVALSLVLCTAAASAETISFGDSTIIWPNAPTTVSLSDDTHGIPDLIGGSFNFDGHVLTQISLNYFLNESSSQSLWNSFTPGDWFFDFDQDGYWDVVIHNTGNNNYSLFTGAWGYGSNGYAATDYVFATAGNTRMGHPTYAKVEGVGTTVAFDGWRSFSEVSGGGVVTSTWDLHLDLSGYSGQGFVYGFTISCANDVLFGEATVPTPEPASIVLAGIGLLGLCGLRKRAKA